jgi:predicted P-loop ATPase
MRRRLDFELADFGELKPGIVSRVEPVFEDCLLLEGRHNEIHCVREYLDGLQWDGTKRLDLWLTMTFGCPSDDYHKAVGSKLLIAAVRRVRKPGSKYDQLVVLEGPRRTSVRALLY